MNPTTSFQAHRRLLFAIAYRMLGSAAEAEDVVQYAWLRWNAAHTTAIESSKAWLSTVVTRLCLDRLKSARRQREEYVGLWKRKRRPVVSSSIGRRRGYAKGDLGSRRHAPITSVSCARSRMP